MTRVLVIGEGKMGRAAAEVAALRGCIVVGLVGRKEMARGVTAGVADVAVEFTSPESAAGNVLACLAVGLPVVSGTTGWDAQLQEVRARVAREGGALLHAPNFSVGVYVFRAIVAAAAGAVANVSEGGNAKGGDATESAAVATSFAAQIIETHHEAKRDAPSGTARLLARTAEETLRENVGIVSVRLGHVPGTHEFVLDAPFEQIRLTHEARDRRVFADGAVAAARWLVGRRGVFTFDDFMQSPREEQS
jgi:4-hydroxy-tetrahydrodipicolinate reductase